MKRHLRSLAPVVASLLLALSVVAQTTPAASPVDASAPIPKHGDARFYELHALFLRAKSQPIGLLFLGDSITEGWSTAPDIWREYYEKYQPANFGISGDKTQNVIWRIEDGELRGIHPKVVVFMLGTNNTYGHTAAQIAAANEKIITLIRERLPETKILLLAIFPRGPFEVKNGNMDAETAKRLATQRNAAAEKRMESIRAVNAELAKLDDGKNVRFLDIGPKFLDAEGRLPSDIMPDQLHPSPAGYKIWAEAMQPLLEEMMR